MKTLLSTHIPFILVILSLVGGMLFSSVKPAAASDNGKSESTSAAKPASAVKDGELARNYLEDLSVFGSRAIDNPGHDKAAAYISAALEDMGYSPTKQPFTNEKNLTAGNIIVEKKGDSDRVIIAGAHYDSVAVGSGIDDNGSGVAVLLEAANRLKDAVTPYTIRFIFFDCEETGQEGSGYYVGKMTPGEVKNTVAMINLDSLAVGDYTYIYGNEGEDGEIRDWALDYAEENGLDLITQSGKNPDYSAGTTVDESDHAPFLYRGIQYAYLEATNWDLGEMDGYTQVEGPYGNKGMIWHTKYDSLEYIEKTFPGRLDEHLTLFSNVLMKILTDYREAD